MPIQHISDTALLTAYARATESLRQDALFQDALAHSLAGERGAALARETEEFATIANSVACRTRVFDDLVMRVIKDEGVDLVLNLGAGLDTRPWRLDLPLELRWIDIDLPGSLAYKTKILGGSPPRCAYEGVAADLRTAAEIRETVARASTSNKVLVLSEGILVYLAEEEVRELASQLYSQPSIAWWITDIAGPKALPMMANAWGDLLAGASLQFAPSEPTEFFAVCGWTETEFHSSQVEAQQLGRAPKKTLLTRMMLGILPATMKDEIRRLSGVTLMRRSLSRPST